MKLLLKLGSALFVLFMILRNVRSAQFHMKTPLGEWTFVKRPPADQKKLRQIARIIRDKRRQGNEE
jgi:hypothetical protein